jgi:hypothetical protein
MFRSTELAKVKRWQGNLAWEALPALIQEPIFGLTQNYRDGFVHRQRFASHLRGEFTRLAPEADGALASSTGIDPDTHLAMALAFYNRILAEAVTRPGQLIVREAGAEPDGDRRDLPLDPERTPNIGAPNVVTERERHSSNS